VAYILISKELTDYERTWQAMRVNAMRDFYRGAGYQTLTVYVDAPDDAAAALANPSTQAVAYFGHAAFPSIEGADAAGLGNSVFITLRDRYQALGLSREEAQAAASARSRALGLDYAYIDTCFSLTDNSLRDYLVRSGGTYWGEENKAYSTGWRTRSVRP